MDGEFKCGLMEQNMRVRQNAKIVIFLGEWRNNKAHGKGKFWHVDGDVFEGNLN